MVGVAPLVEAERVVVLVVAAGMVVVQGVSVFAVGGMAAVSLRVLCPPP